MKTPQTIDWRKEVSATDFDPDDNELEHTPVDVIAALGFDPKDEEIPANECNH
jgi:hypothetical protein